MGKLKLNPNLKERRIGFFFMAIFLGIMVIYFLYDGWLYEWIEYGYAGANQHFDLNIFGDMDWILDDGVEGGRIYNSTNNLHNTAYICYWTATAAYLGLIFDNKWLRQGAMGTMAFPVISFFSTINPLNATDILNPNLFYYHTFLIQIMYDLTHVCGMILAVYIMYSAAKKEESISYKHITPVIMFTWVLFLISRLTLQKWPFWAPENALGAIGTNQINDMPFIFFGLEYGVVIALLYVINFSIKSLNKRIKSPMWQAIAPFAIFIVFTVVLMAAGLIVLQEIPYTAFVGN